MSLLAFIFGSPEKTLRHQQADMIAEQSIQMLENLVKAHKQLVEYMPKQYDMSATHMLIGSVEGACKRMREMIEGPL